MKRRKAVFWNWILPNLKSMYPSPPDITSIDLFSPFPAIELEPPLDGERGSVFDDGLDDEGEVFADIADNPPWPKIDICS